MSYTTEQLNILQSLAAKKAETSAVPENLMPDALADAAGISQKDLAEFLGVHPVMLSNIKSGNTKRPFTYIAALKRVGLWVD